MDITKTIYSNNPEETQSVGRELGSAIRGFLTTHPIAAEAIIVLALSGDLGAGKTTFTQGLALGIGVKEQVTSPTFTLVNEYQIDGHEQHEDVIHLIHIDSYRLAEGHHGVEGHSEGGEEQDNAILDAATFGMEELFEMARSVIVVEWADRIASILPSDHLAIQFSYGVDQAPALAESQHFETPAEVDQSRTIELSAHGPHSKLVLSPIA